MEAELLSTLDELKRYRNKYRQLKNFVIEQKKKQGQEEKEIDSLISELRNQIMEAMKKEECLGELIKEKQQNCEQLEVEMVQLRDELKSKRVQDKFENNSTVLDNILKIQRKPSSKEVLGYEQKGNNGFPNIIKNHPKSHVEALLEKSMKKGERTSTNQ